MGGLEGTSTGPEDWEGRAAGGGVGAGRVGCALATTVDAGGGAG